MQGYRRAYSFYLQYLLKTTATFKIELRLIKEELKASKVRGLMNEERFKKFMWKKKLYYYYKRLFKLANNLKYLGFWFVI